MSKVQKDSSSYTPSFVVIPAYVWNLEGITLNFLKIYETIFQFWHKEMKCFLTNYAIMERTGIKSEGTIRAAFAFFEQHNLLKRVTNEKTGQRFLVQPSRYIEIDHTPKPVDNPVNDLTPPRQNSDAPPSENRRHNINNYNVMNINKSSCKNTEQKKDNEKKHDWAKEGKPSPLASVESQSTSYDPNRKCSADKASSYLEEYMKKNPLGKQL